jgi:hypothetical protein
MVERMKVAYDQRRDELILLTLFAPISIFNTTISVRAHRAKWDGYEYYISTKTLHKHGIVIIGDFYDTKRRKEVGSI